MRFPDGFPVYAGLAGIDPVPARVFDRTSFRSGGGGMNGTAGDMLKFVEAIRTRRCAHRRSRDTAKEMMTIQTVDMPIVNRVPGWAFGYGGSILTDPAAALTPQSPGTFGWGGVWGHTWFIEPTRRLELGVAQQHRVRGHDGPLCARPAQCDLRGDEFSSLGAAYLPT